MKTLEQILEQEKKVRTESGEFGIRACKDSIRFERRISNKSLYLILEEYVEKVNKDKFFNSTMVLACWELINER